MLDVAQGAAALAATSTKILIEIRRDRRRAVFLFVRNLFLECPLLADFVAEVI
jgi:hypothetical protein